MRWKEWPRLQKRQKEKRVQKIPRKKEVTKQLAKKLSRQEKEAHEQEKPK